MSFDALWPFLLAPLLVVPFLVARRSDLRWPPARLRAALILRVLAAAFLLLALTRPVVPTGSRDAAVAFVVDVSRSVSGNAVRDAVAWAESAGRSLPAGSARFVAFADRPVTVPAAADLLRVSVFDSSTGDGRAPEGALDQGRTDIEAALRHAAAGFPADRLKRLVLFTDGRATEGDADRAVAALRQAGVRTFPVPSEVRSDGGGLVSAVRTPPGVRAGEMTPVEVDVFSASGGPAVVSLRSGSRTVASVEAAIPRGASTVIVPARIEEPGMTALEASIQVAGDRLAVNDRRIVETPVGERARVLYVEGQPESRRYLEAALESEGIDVSTAAPAALGVLPLDEFDAVVLSDIAAERIPEPTMERLAGYVRDAGGGLVFAAGESSFGEDGYSDSVLERVLPLDFRIEEKWKDLSLVIVLDKSYSMYGRKIALAKEATKAALDLLEEKHRFGVVTFDWNPYTTIPLQLVEDREWIREGISRIQASAQTNIYPALERAYEQLDESPSEVKHVILLSDGKTYPDEYEELVARMQEDEITISTVAVGEEADRELLSEIAEWGDGRSYFIRDAARVQQIFIEETQIALDATLVEEPFRPVVRQEARVLDGLDFETAPELKGYVATMPKAAAEVLLEASDEEPLFARWQYGLGRAAMFTSDCKNRWAADWMGWDGYGKFWTQVVRDAMRRSAGPEVDFEIVRSGGEATVHLSLVGSDGSFPTGVAPRLEVAYGGREGAAVMRQTGPARFEADVPLDLAPGGAARFRIAPESLPGEFREAGELERVVRVSYPDEYRFLPPDRETLRTWAEETGGKVSPSPAEVLAAGDDRVVRARALWPLLALLGLLCYLLDLSVRRTPWAWTRLFRFLRTARAGSTAALAVLAVPLIAQCGSGTSPPGEHPWNRLDAARPIAAEDTVFIEDMTWMEVRDRIAAGATTAILATGGIEQNGPYVVTGKHNLVLRATTEAIARRLGDALVAPIIKLVPEGDHDPPSGHMRYPGTISLTQETFEMLLTDAAKSLAASGFLDLLLIGDSGGNQAGMEAVSKRLNAAWAGRGVRLHPIRAYYDEDLWSFEQLKTELGVRQVPDVRSASRAGIHDDYHYDAILATVDPAAIRMSERRAAGLFEINGAPLDPLDRTIANGLALVARRAEITARAFRESRNRR